MAFLALLSGPIGKIAGCAIVVMGLLGTVSLWAHEHAARIVADVAAKQARIEAAAAHDQDQRTIAGLSKAAATATARAASLATLKGSINAAALSSVCAASPAARAFVAGLRSAEAGISAAPAAATLGVGVPGPAAAAR